MRNKIQFLMSTILIMVITSCATFKSIDNSPSLKEYRIGGEFERNELTYLNELGHYLTPIKTTVGNLDGVIGLLSKDGETIRTLLFLSLLPNEDAYLVGNFIEAVNTRYATTFNEDELLYSMIMDDKIPQFAEVQKGKYSFTVAITFDEEVELYELKFVISDNYNDAIEDF